MNANPKPRPNKLNLFLDLTLLAGFLITMEERLTGRTLHEWLGIALGAALMIHLFLHWNWIVTVTQRFVGNLSRRTRLNTILNAALFITFGLIMISGLLISESVVGMLGLSGSRDPFWRILHSAASNAVLVLVGLHIALHWKWVVNTFNRHVLARGRAYFGRRPATNWASTPSPQE